MGGFFSALMSPFETALIAGFGIFRHNEVAIALALVMLLTGLGLGLRFWWRQMRPLFETFDWVGDQIRRYPDGAAFATAFREVDSVLSEPAFLRHGWQEFTSTLIHPDKGSGEPIRYTLRPSLYLNAATIETGGINLQLQKALPNFFVGFGLLFTFIGLVAALFFANQGVASPNIAVAQEALRNLLHAATFKFLTSVAGLMVSLGLAITNRILLQRLHNRFVDLCEALEHRMAFMTAESLQYDQYRETVRQSERFAEFRAGFAGEVATALQTAQAPLAASMEHLADNLKDVNKEALAQMAAQFIEALNKTAAKELNAIAATLDQLNRDLGGLIDRLGQTGEGFGARVEGAGNTLEGLLSAGSKSLHETLDESGRTFSARLETAGRSLHEPVAALTGRWEQLEQVFAQLDERQQRQFEAFGEAVSGLSETVALLEGTTGNLREVSAPIGEITEEMGQAADRVAAATQAVAQAQEHLKGLADELVEGAETARASWEAYRRRFEETNDDLADVLRESVADAQATQDAAETIARAFKEDLRRSLDPLDGNIRSLDVRMQDMTNTIKNLTKALKSVVRRSED